ncbi:MAG: 4Fe-4S dicluster domain-containing protein [Deltaproteobacteria bacterium]|nr:4Fe-4S dicluster domain-containing protein [Deltaproteobacteria bacterium]
MGNVNDFKFLSERGFQGLVKGLLKELKVYGTIVKDGFPAFGEISAPEELVLSSTPTHLSAKEFFFPQREVLLKFNIKTAAFSPVIESVDQAIIGMHPCDIRALSLMDRVFAAGTPDPNYLSRRSKTLIIGSDCMPDDYCFCKSLGNSEAESGFDIFLHALGKGFLVRTGSDKGRAALLKYAKLRAPSTKEFREFQGLCLKRDSSFKAKVDAPPAELPSIYAKSDESKVWQKIGAICTGCGSCNNVCPTCYCFDVKDEVKASLAEGERVRNWDGCTLEDFAKVAGGHNFRKTRAERLRHRFNRKFRYLSSTFDSLFCVGCGRCSRACLVKINIVEVTNELVSECHNK